MSEHSEPAVVPTAIHSVTIGVDDHDRALAFYTGVLGCALQFDGEGLPGERLVALAPPGSAVAMMLIARDSRLPIGVRYVIEDADAAHAALTAAGVVPHTDVLHLPGSPPMFTVTDSEGNTVILMEQPQW